jgi:hypothetical protein
MDRPVGTSPGIRGGRNRHSGAEGEHCCGLDGEQGQYAVTTHLFSPRKAKFVSDGQLNQP